MARKVRLLTILRIYSALLDSIPPYLGKSAAENAKIKKGDVIQKFDTHSITSLADLRLALFYAEYGKAYEIVVKRDDDKIKLNIELIDRNGFSASP